MKEVAARAQVGLGTVSAFLNTPERVSPARRQRISDAIDALGYVRNEVARQLKAGTSRTIVLVPLEVDNPFFGEVAVQLERRVAEAGLFLSIVSSGGLAEREGEYISSLVEQRVAGVILASGLTPEHSLRLLRTRQVPTVLLDAYAPSETFSTTRVDDFMGASLAIEHLADQGCRSIALVGADEQVHQIVERVRGASDAAERRGVALVTVQTTVRSVAEGRRAGTWLHREVTSDRIDGVFALNDLLALGVMQSVVGDAGARIPDDLLLVGYDDTDLAASAGVPLTSVRRPVPRLVETAMDLLSAQQQGELAHRDVLIPPELIVRVSSVR